MAKAPASPPTDHAPKKSCFIIMPISTPEHYAGLCEGDKEHFQHVLECLFIPAITAAGFEPTPPASKGADMIHAHIIENLNTADLVFCDMSSLNANVFFEFGIRTALNKPICLVKDELTKHVPFDTGIINHHTYSSKMAAWELTDQIGKLTKHVRASHERNGGDNPLWKYFGLKISSKFETGESTVERKLDLLSMEIAALREVKPLLQKATSGSTEAPTEQLAECRRFIVSRIRGVVEKHGGTLLCEWDKENGVDFNIFGLERRDEKLIERLIINTLLEVPRRWRPPRWSVSNFPEKLDP